jgi:NAD(P)-dependent dehydrogenase (short-subunit alcohol dehydrogenase family)
VDLELEGSRIVVTGGSSGIGLATVRALIAEGAFVATCARDGSRLASATSGMDVARLFARRCDVLDARACDEFVAEAVDFLGGLDGLVNNAGRGRPGGLADLSDAAWSEELEGKIFSVLHPLRAALPHLRRSAHPRVVNVSAVTAREPQPELLGVSAARAALSNLSRGLASELLADGIMVNTVSLGVIATGRARERHRASAPDQPFDVWAGAEARRRRVPLGRLGEPEEAAVAIVWLLSPLASYITGATLDVAGGLNSSW